MKTASRLPSPCREEAEVTEALRGRMANALDWPAVLTMARPWVKAVRMKPAPFRAPESLLQEYPISSREGLA